MDTKVRTTLQGDTPTAPGIARVDSGKSLDRKGDQAPTTLAYLPPRHPPTDNRTHGMISTVVDPFSYHASLFANDGGGSQLCAQRYAAPPPVAPPQHYYTQFAAAPDMQQFQANHAWQRVIAQLEAQRHAASATLLGHPPNAQAMLGAPMYPGTPYSLASMGGPLYAMPNAPLGAPAWWPPRGPVGPFATIGMAGGGSVFPIDPRLGGYSSHWGPAGAHGTAMQSTFQLPFPAAAPWIPTFTPTSFGAAVSAVSSVTPDSNAGSGAPPPSL
jgi:hypothetical protein